MRLKKLPLVNKRRRGLSFVEVVASTIIVAMLVTMAVAMASIMRANTRDTLSYTAMKTYSVDKIEKIKMDLETDVEIDTVDYNDTGETSGIEANVVVRDVGTMFGSPLYHVEISMRHKETQNITTTQTTLRKGCIAYAP